MTIKDISKNSLSASQTKRTIVIKKNYNMGIVGNILWILSNKKPISSEETLKIHEFDQTLSIKWNSNCHDFLNQLLLGYNLLKNAGFRKSEKKSITGWAFDLQKKAVGGINFSKDWTLEAGNTAFLSATNNEPRPSMSSDQKILVTSHHDTEYRFSGYFATHRVNGLITLTQFDKKNTCVSKKVISIQNSAQFGGGKTLQSYEYIESIFTPEKDALYIQFKIEMGEQIDNSLPNAYLFCTQLFLGINIPHFKSPEDFINSPGINKLTLDVLEKNWSTFGIVELPNIENNKKLSVEYLNKLTLINLQEELSVIRAINNNEKRDHKKAKAFLKKESLEKLISIESLDYEKLLQLNDQYKFDTLYLYILNAVNQQQPKTIKLHSEAYDNALFYTYMGLEREKQGTIDIAENCYKTALFFTPHPLAFEHLGNISLNRNQFNLAIMHYNNAVTFQTQSHWVYINLAQALEQQGNFEKAIETLLDAATKIPESKLLQDKLSNTLEKYWQNKSEIIDFLASINDRNNLLEETQTAVKTISETYRKSLLRLSTKQSKNKKGCKKVLIIADTFLPQCLRYRVKQKLEQIEQAGLEANYICWTKSDSALQNIPWYDQIIFYRVPAFPQIIHLIEYAHSIGKPTFYEIDDLIFDPSYPAHIASYGDNINALQYYDLIKGMALYRCAANLCDYALASTQPLLEKLAPLVKTKQGFLHRNALDSNTIFDQKKEQNKDHLTIFYGSGTLAHNSDFIDEVLPALEKILGEFKYVRLVIAGYLQLPDKFIKNYKNQVILLPFTKSFQVYNNYLKRADINIAVLKQDEINDCKSELKWFEAACFGIPSVVSQTRNYQDVINHEIDGFIVNNLESWHETIKQLVVQPELRESIGNAAFLRVKKDYSLEAMSKNIAQIFSQIDGQG